MLESRETATYERLYYSLWEAARRYGAFCEFRVIGKTHDERMIPMLEAGRGDTVLFCAAGFKGTDRDMPRLLTNMALEYCRAYECGWKLEGIYPVRELLDQVRIGFIPLVNPDGYEICRRGYSAVRSPVHRQMLLMQDQSHREFTGNARGKDIACNFPARGCTGKYLHREPASENETRALIRIFQEYQGQALFTFAGGRSMTIRYQSPKGLRYAGKGCRAARHLKRLAKERNGLNMRTSASGIQGFAGAETFFAQVMKKPAFHIELPSYTGRKEKQELAALSAVPLEFLLLCHP